MVEQYFTICKIIEIRMFIKQQYNFYNKTLDNNNDILSIYLIYTLLI